MQTKNFYREASSGLHALFILSTFAMIGFSAYLTSHYYEIKFPSHFSGASLCNINQFFNCDVTTHSSLSNIAGVPISLFGVLMGLFGLFGYLFTSEKIERTNRTLFFANALGCFFLFLYSLFFLGGLCPFCTLYYIASWAAAFAQWKNNKTFSFDFHLIPLLSYLIFTLAISTGAYSYSQEKLSKKNRQTQSLLKSYDALQEQGDPPLNSPYQVISATPQFKDAPIRISKFSDFECPACKALSDTFHRLGNMERYRGKISIQYFFYPLDMNCNPSVKRPLHQNACLASYLAACLPEKFSQIEKLIFSQQNNLSAQWLEGIAQKENILECFRSQETKVKIREYIKMANSYKIQSTPTWILNGRKIEGTLPLSSLTSLIDSLLKRQGQ